MLGHSASSKTHIASNYFDDKNNCPAPVSTQKLSRPVSGTRDSGDCSTSRFRGLAIDIGYLYSAKRHLQTAADAAAMVMVEFAFVAALPFDSRCNDGDGSGGLCV
jgi:hypothetical protein